PTASRASGAGGVRARSCRGGGSRRRGGARGSGGPQRRRDLLRGTAAGGDRGAPRAGSRWRRRPSASPLLGLGEVGEVDLRLLGERLDLVERDRDRTTAPALPVVDGRERDPDPVCELLLGQTELATDFLQQSRDVQLRHRPRPGSWGSACLAL